MAKMTRQDANEAVRQYAESVDRSYAKAKEKLAESLASEFMLSSFDMEAIFVAQYRAHLAKMTVGAVGQKADGRMVDEVDAVGAQIERATRALLHGYDDGTSTSPYANAESAAKRAANRWYLDTFGPIASSFEGEPSHD